jgi:hypothetical protein
MVDITVPVPDERIPEFYTFFGLWLREGLSLPAEPSEASPSGSQASEATPTNREWGASDDDLADAVWLWSKCSAPARRFFSLLIDNPGTKFTGGQIAEACSISNGAHGVAGVLAHPARFGRQIGRSLPSHWRPDPETFDSYYWMTDERAALFAAAREQVAAEEAA